MEEQYEELVSLIKDPVMIDGKYYSLESEINQLVVYNKKISATRIRKILQMIRFKTVDMRNEAQSIRNSI